MNNLKVLCIHGIGGKENSQSKKEKWQKDWKEAFLGMNFTNPQNISFMDFDSHFKDYDADWSDYKDFFEKTFIDDIDNRRYSKGLIKEWFDFFPDMVIEFLMDKNEIRSILREELKKTIIEKKPDIIYAHSLGGMMCYDFFTQPENYHYSNITLVTAGTQLGNPALKNHSLKQPVEFLPVKFWYNLNNPKDKVFARHSINLPINKNYKEIKTEFRDAFINHNGLEYLNHPNAIKDVWNHIKK